ncbi:MAG: glutathione peroxidase [Niastella sp.]|nr:glutathione peroxidase [Niastella sp.]
MSNKQKAMVFIYPLLSRITKWIGKSQKIIKSTSMAPESFYLLNAVLIHGETFSFESLKGKKVLLVNTASDCGYTPQYKGLEQLHQQEKDRLVIIGFPSNDFGEQEKGSNNEIGNFCEKNFGVTFLLTQKSIVKKMSGQDPVYKWLTDETKNGWNDVAPSWNFCKYLVNEEGNLTHFFESGIEPLSKKMADAIHE